MDARAIVETVLDREIENFREAAEALPEQAASLLNLAEALEHAKSVVLKALDNN